MDNENQNEQETTETGEEQETQGVIPANDQNLGDQSTPNPTEAGQLNPVEETEFDPEDEESELDHDPIEPDEDYDEPTEAATESAATSEDEKAEYERLKFQRKNGAISEDEVKRFEVLKVRIEGVGDNAWSTPSL